MARRELYVWNVDLVDCNSSSAGPPVCSAPIPIRGREDRAWFPVTGAHRRRRVTLGGFRPGVRGRVLAGGGVVGGGRVGGCNQVHDFRNEPLAPREAWVLRRSPQHEQGSRHQPEGSKYRT